MEIEPREQEQEAEARNRDPEANRPGGFAEQDSRHEPEQHRTGESVADDSGQSGNRSIGGGPLADEKLPRLHTDEDTIRQKPQRREPRPRLGRQAEQRGDLQGRAGTTNCPTLNQRVLSQGRMHQKPARTPTITAQAGAKRHRGAGKSVEGTSECVCTGAS